MKLFELTKKGLYKHLKLSSLTDALEGKTTVFLKLGVVIFIAGVFFLSQENEACAAKWGPNCSSAAPDHKTCPSGGTLAVGTCVDSVNLQVSINIIEGVMKPGSTITVNAKFKDIVCSAVTCLKRSETRQLTYTGDGSTSVFIDTLGCSGGACNDDWDIQATTNDPKCKYSGTLYPDGNDAKNMNGKSMGARIQFRCSTGPTNPPLTLPRTSGVPLPSFPMCPVPGEVKNVNVVCPFCAKK